jgi:hypothetical protein
LTAKPKSDYLLDCTSYHEAQKVIDELVRHGLIHSAELIGHSPGNITNNVKLILSSTVSNLGQIEAKLNEALSRSFELIKLPGLTSDTLELAMPAKI